MKIPNLERNFELEDDFTLKASIFGCFHQISSKHLLGLPWQRIESKVNKNCVFRCPTVYYQIFMGGGGAGVVDGEVVTVKDA